MIQVGCPAHAGIGPGPLSSGYPAAGLPRTRGDRPLIITTDRRIYTVAPHTRG